MNDLFLLRLIQEIDKWYDEYYHGIDLEDMKKYHIHKLITHYDEERFIVRADKLFKERKKFLQEVQLIVDMRTCE